MPPTLFLQRSNLTALMISRVDANKPMCSDVFAVVANIIVAIVLTATPCVLHTRPSRTGMVGTSVGATICATCGRGLCCLSEEALAGNDRRNAQHHFPHHREKASPGG